MESEVRRGKLTPREMFDRMVARMPEEDAEVLRSFHYAFTEAAFIGRTLLVVQTKGRRGRIPRPAITLGKIIVEEFHTDPDRGASALLRDKESDRLLRVGHVPVRLFDYAVFVAVPIIQTLEYGGGVGASGQLGYTLVFGLRFFQEHAFDGLPWKGVCVVTPKQYQDVYGKGA